MVRLVRAARHRVLCSLDRRGRAASTRSTSLLQSCDWSRVDVALRAVCSGAPLPGSSDSDGGTPRLPAPPPRSRGLTQDTWALTIAYYGPAFTAFTWQSREPKRSVVGCVEAAIQPLLRGELAHRVSLSAAGRTDAGVSASAQLVSFVSWPELDAHEIRAAVDAAAPGRLRSVGVARVPRDFSAPFSAHWRHYVYLLPAHPGLCADALNSQLSPLVGASHDFGALGRGLQPSKSTSMTLHRCGARRVECGMIRIDAVGDRFLRGQARRGW